MAYSKTDWQNLPSTTTPLNRTNLNKIENQLLKSDILNTASDLINSGDNLNNYMTYGIYTSNSGAISGSLVNSPVTESAFKLIVEYLHDSTRIRQTIYSNTANSATYVRTYNGSWGAWIRRPSYNLYEIPLTEITENSNINNYFTPGTYFCATGAVAQTLTNCPATTGFKLVSEQLHNRERYRQTIYTNTATSDTYVRTYTGSWGSWMKINMTAV